MAKKKGMGAGMWVIMALLILSLGGFGITQFGSSVQTVAEVGDVEISANEYARAVQSQMNAFQREAGQPVNFQTAQALVAMGRAPEAEPLFRTARERMYPEHPLFEMLDKIVARLDSGTSA